jgi:hypothetical protein
MSAEYGTVYVVYKPTAHIFERKSIRRSYRTKRKIYGGRSIRRRRHDLCDEDTIVPENTGRNRTIWESLWGPPQHQEIQSTCDREWENTDNELGVEFQQIIKILGITFSNTIDRAMHENWEQMTRRVKAQAKNAYERDLCIAQRVRYVQIYLLATIWYTAQIFPAPLKYTQQLTTAINWYI